MMEPKDILSFFIGLVLFALGLLPILNHFGIGPSWFNVQQLLPATVFIWIAAVGGLYLVINSVIEITNSAAIGGLSIAVAFVCLVVGIMPLMHSFGIGPSFFALDFLGGFADYLFNVVLLIEGVFLMLAMIFMEM